MNCLARPSGLRMKIGLCILSPSACILCTVASLKQTPCAFYILRALDSNLKVASAMVADLSNVTSEPFFQLYRIRVYL